MKFESLSNLTTHLQRGLSPKYADSGIPVINQKCIRNGQLNYQDIKFHNKDKTYSSEKELVKDDILVNSTGVGTLGRVARFLNKNELMLADSHVTIVRPDKEMIDPTYLFYVLRLNEKAIVELGSGSTGQTELSRMALGSLQIPLPEKNTQRYIADTLSCIDEKITANGKLSKTLEDIAQTIFKSWFIDFDPVKAKMAGEKPAGMDAATSALFPDAMKESELGLIPQGWQIGILDDIIEIYDSKRIPLAGAERKKRPGKYPYYGATGALDFIDSFIFEGPHILVGEDGTVITDSGTPLVQYVWNKFWVSNHAHVLQAKNGFSVEQLKLLIERIQISNYITGAVQPKLNQGNLKSIPCIIPPTTVSAAFGSVIEPIFRNIRRLTDENKVLVELRDSLMPRLISGELQIPEEMLAT
jgi:restriction endonuclease S subunit